MKKNDRYEIKMVFDGFQVPNARSWIFAHSYAFDESYPPRQVNNIYFDTHERDFMSAHLDGEPSRAKLRLRWYGETWQPRQSQLELKIKHARLGTKLIDSISIPIDISSLTWVEITDILKVNSRKPFSALLEETLPVIINRYIREYYVSFDQSIRITLDYDMQTFGQSFGFSPNIFFLQPILKNGIIEFKCDSTEIDKLPDIIAEFPIYCSQNSKYLSGIENVI